MELKRILARDARSANEKAIQTFGSDVLVISTQRVGDQIELIVAVEATPDSPTALAPNVHSQTSGSHLRQEKAEVFAEIFGFVQRQETERIAGAEDTQVGADTPPRQEPVESLALVEDKSKAQTRALSASVTVDTVAQPASTLGSEVQVSDKPKKPAVSKTRQKPKPAAKSRPDLKKQKSAAVGRADELQLEWVRHLECVELLRQEVGVLRREMQLQRQVLPWQSQQSFSPEAAAVADELARLGVPVGLRTLMLEALKTTPAQQGTRLALKNILESHLAGCVSASIEPGVHALVGPSGAGKTSMAVRMAHAMAQVDGPQSQVIISHADLRPGAWSQIQMLASSVGIDVYRAANDQALAVLLEELKPRRHIWIDTASDAHFGRDSTLRQAHPAIAWHAVVPLDASVTTLRRMQDQRPWQSLMITKADEGFHVWQWLQAFSEHPLPVSRVSFSDFIQEPARAFDPQDWVQQALDDLKLSEPPANGKPKRAARKAATQNGKAEHV